MSFKKWLEKSHEAFAESVIDRGERQGIKIEGNTVILPHSFDERSLRLFIAYENQKMNRRLVWATWILSIGTLILSGLTLYFQLF